MSMYILTYIKPSVPPDTNVHINNIQQSIPPDTNVHIKYIQPSIPSDTNVHINIHTTNHTTRYQYTVEFVYNEVQVTIDLSSL